MRQLKVILWHGRLFDHLHAAESSAMSSFLQHPQPQPYNLSLRDYVCQGLYEADDCRFHHSKYNNLE